MIAVISHDAGGAEILSSYVRQHGLDCCFVLEGPARRIFERKLGNIEVCTIAEAIQRSTSILCGTSWQSDIELNAIKQARLLNKHSVSYLDHWINYHDRFVRSDATILPDEIWVGDATAETMARKVFPGIMVKLVGNPYFQDIQQELAVTQVRRPSSPDSLSVLYVCEPISKHALMRYGSARFWGYVEEDALRYFLSNISALGKPIERILIRPHPSERAEKYGWVQAEFDLPIEMGGGRALLEEIADSDAVVGCQSMAMVVALLAGKKVVSCIPPEGKRCVLPYTEIVSLRDILENVRTSRDRNEL